MKRTFWTVPLTLAILIATLWMAYTVYNDPGTTVTVPPGDPAHPLTFMTQAELDRTLEYSRTKDALYFASVGFEWVIYLFLLGAGLSGRFRDTALRFFKKSTLGQVTLYTLLLQLAMTLLELPLDWYRHMVDVNYGISTMTAADWFLDLGKGFLIGTLMFIPVVWLAYLFIRKSPGRWWLWMWLVSIPLIVFMVIIQPLVIDPMYNDFKPLQNQELKQQILDLAHKAEIPSDNVYEVDMSTKTNALNAYVNGLGPSARIVLWDTTLQKLDANEILFIMGHEMGHYVMKHILWGLGSAVVILFGALYLLSKLYHRTVRLLGEGWNVRSTQDLAALPAALLLLSVLSFLTSPLDNYISRTFETSSDNYAVEITGDPAAGISSFQKLARLSLSDPNPPELVRFFRYSHPTISERIEALEQQMKQGKQTKAHDPKETPSAK